MSINICLFNLLLVICMTSCHDEPSFDFSAYHASLLDNIWIHAYEGNCEGKLMVFKNDPEYYLTSWRFRNRLELFVDGTAIYTIATPFDPHINEASHTLRGKWKYDRDLKTLKLLDENGTIKYLFDVKVISEETLILTYKELHLENQSG